MLNLQDHVLVHTPANVRERPNRMIQSLRIGVDEQLISVITGCETQTMVWRWHRRPMAVNKYSVSCLACGSQAMFLVNHKTWAMQHSSFRRTATIAGCELEN